MSGGAFDYKQYIIRDIADEIEQEIVQAGRKIPTEVWKNDWHGYSFEENDQYYTTYNHRTIDILKRAVYVLRMAHIYAQRIDWMLSGDEGVTDENLQKAIAAITWKPFDTIYTVVGPRKRVKVTFYPCDDEHYPAPEEESRCIIRYLDEGQYQYWQMRHCPWGWNVLEHNEAEYCILPMTD